MARATLSLIVSAAVLPLVAPTASVAAVPSKVKKAVRSEVLAEYPWDDVYEPDPPEVQVFDCRKSNARRYTCSWRRFSDSASMDMHGRARVRLYSSGAEATLFAVASGDGL